MICPRCGRKSSGKICVWCRSGRNLSEYSIKDYDKYSAEIPEEDSSIITNDRNDNDFPVTGDVKNHIPQNGGAKEAESESPSENTKDQKEPIDPNGRGRSRKRRVTRQPQRNSDHNDKRDSKKKKEKDSKIRAMQSELEDLRARQQEHDRLERDRKRQEKQDRRQNALEAKRQSRAEKVENTAEKVIVEKTVKEPAREAGNPAVLAIVGFSRFLQLASAVLMALLTVMSAFSFWQNRDGLGGVMTVVDERNYALALYLASAAGVIFLGIVWTLWIMSRKGAGGEVRMKTYDTGRGLIPFLLCLGAVYAVTRLSGLVPEDPAMWHGMAKAVAAGVTAVQMESRQMMLVSLAGAGLSLIRRLLRV